MGAADAAVPDWLAPMPALAPEAAVGAAALGAAALATPVLAGKGGADVPRPASDANVIGVVRVGVCGCRAMSTFVSFFACA
ncbi:hypothetical protein B0G57_13032 [Trinickia symbiotica]|uniref:hypothetical protein n=1 Tax=Trinickia TaxID=2571160 RepID=UPI00037BD3AD|nr:hypothetical protein [Trinickia symbiotica]PPK41446.1 hypothetical protein B0G57_13032 [Trinickia symbiotica]